MMGFSMIRLSAVPLAALALALASPGQSTNRKHTIALKFNYDFRITPACSPKVTADCVQQFVAYDISAGIAKRTKLLVIPLPEHAKGFVKGIAATSPPLLFEPGKHLLAVSAQMPNGKESYPALCTVWVRVP